MEKLKGFEKLFEKKLGDEEKIVASGERFLGVFTDEALSRLEDLLRLDLGVYKARRRRPFIGRLERDFYLIVFLTTKTYSKRRVDLSLCYRGKNKACQSLDVECFILRDRNRQEVLAYMVHKDRFREFKYEFCGTCRDLEFLDSLRREYFR